MKHKEGQKKKLEKRSFVLYQHSGMVYLKEGDKIFTYQNVIPENLDK